MPTQHLGLQLEHKEHILLKKQFLLSRVGMG